MSSDTEISHYGRAVTEHVETITQHNAEVVELVARAVVEAGRSGHLVHAAGAGHSLAGVLEMFFRAGGLPFVNPLWHPDILPLNGARRSTDAERRPGLGADVARATGMRAGDVVMVFSTSGINPYPVEIARHGRDVGAMVVAVTSVEASAAAPLRAGVRLAEIADHVLDTCVPPGDVTWPHDDPRVAPSSSLANVHCWNLVMAAALRIDPELPTWRSANTAGPETHNARLQAKYEVVVPTI